MLLRSSEGRRQRSIPDQVLRFGSACVAKIGILGGRLTQQLHCYAGLTLSHLWDPVGKPSGIGPQLQYESVTRLPQSLFV